jgi:hypothetical protein
MWGMDWIDLAQDRNRWRALVNAAMNHRAPYNAGNFLTSWEPVSFLRRTVLNGVSKYISKHCIKRSARKERLNFVESRQFLDFCWYVALNTMSVKIVQWTQILGGMSEKCLKRQRSKWMKRREATGYVAVLGCEAVFFCTCFLTFRRNRSPTFY